MMPISADGVEWNETWTRRAVQGRSGGWCENRCGRRASDMHHRRNASQGGKWHPSNIIHLCRQCHHKVTVWPNWAHGLGLTLRTGERPHNTPVQIHGLDVFFTDELIAKAGKNA